MIIKIFTENCLICGKKLDMSNRSSLVKAHLIPKTLSPKDNILTYFHKPCEERINKLYIHQKKKFKLKKLKGILSDSIDKLSKKLKEVDELENAM